MNDSFTAFEEFFRNVSINGSEILFGGQQKCTPNHAYGPAARPNFLMVYVKSGKGVFRARGTSYHLKEGATFVAFPGENVFYMADGEDPWHYQWIAFNGSYLGKLLARASISPHSPVSILPDNLILPELYERVLSVTADSESYADVKITSLLLDILYEYIRCAGNADLARTEAVIDPSSEHIYKAIDFIRDNYYKNISVSDVADYLGVTREHFHFLFKKHFKASPSHFIRNYRLQCARVLLLTTDYSISRIAELCGFSDYNYFSRQFCALNGIPPSQYRQEALADYHDSRLPESCLI